MALECKWLDRKKALRIKASTIKSYEDYIRTHIEPNLGYMPIQEITLRDIESFYADYLRTHTVNSARKVHVVVVGAFQEAVRAGAIKSNVAKNMEFPNAEKFTGASAYTEQQVGVLLEAVKRAGEPIRAAVILAVCYGLRRSEVLGLRWKDIDFENRTLTVCNTIVQNGKLRIEAEDTKTAKSHRSISLLSSTIPYFEELKRTQESAGINLDKICVWPNGESLRPDYVTRKVKQIMIKCGLPVIRFHDLRHTAASLLAPHVTPSQLQEFLGHEDISTTLGIYTHVMNDQRKATSEMMDSLMEKAAISF